MYHISEAKFGCDPGRRGYTSSRHMIKLSVAGTHEMRPSLAEAKFGLSPGRHGWVYVLHTLFMSGALWTLIN